MNPLMNLQPTVPLTPSDALMKPSKVAAAVAGDPSFFEGLVDAQAMSGSGHHHHNDGPLSAGGNFAPDAKGAV